MRAYTHLNPAEAVEAPVMQKLNLKSVLEVVRSIAVAVPFLFVLTSASQAQVRNRPAEDSRRVEQDMMSREWNLNHSTEEANKQFKKDQVSLFRQIHEDFTRMQIVNNETMKAIFVNKSIDYKQISAATEEIRRRALRLKQSLVLPKATEVEKVRKNSAPLNDEQLKAVLLTLDHSVMSFVTNPLFTVPNVINSKLSETATRDLERIIQLSESIRRDVERIKPTRSPN
jgi:hypothetical protein